MADSKEPQVAVTDFHENNLPINLPQAFRDVKFAKRLAIDIGELRSISVTNYSLFFDSVHHKRADFSYNFRQILNFSALSRAIQNIRHGLKKSLKIIIRSLNETFSPS